MEELVNFIFLDWISCNLWSLFTLTIKNDCENSGSGLGCVIPIEKALTIGATHVNAILLNIKFQ